MADVLTMTLLVAVALIDCVGIAAFGFVTLRGVKRSDPVAMGVGLLIVLACACSLSTIPMPVATGPGASTGVEG